MRRTSALFAVTSMLLGGTVLTVPTTVQGPVQQDAPVASATAATPPTQVAPPAAARPSVSEPASGTSTPQASPEPSVAWAEGQATDGQTQEPTAAASQRPALTSILDPSAGTTRVATGGSVAGNGPVHRYSVEVERSIGLDVEEVRAIVEASLHDTERSWARTRTLQRVDDPAAARIRIVIASPATVDAICATVGLNTAGIFSCWTGRIAALNASRWETGAAGFADLTTYRIYLVNHEFGHALGYGHRGCPGAGALAPVMMQQSKGLAGCQPNGWPYP
jgi:hypothetical protein